MSGIGGWIDFKKSLFDCESVGTAILEKLKAGEGELSGLYMQREVMLGQSGIRCGEWLARDAGGETLAIVFDGYLTNRDELIGELSRLNHRIYEESDAEAILCSYMEWGESCLDKLEGAYSFAVWRERAKALFAARDRMGVKPFYFYEFGNGLAFSSRIKALFECPKIRPALDEQGLMQIFLLGPGKICGSGVYKGVRELEPGQCLKYDKEGLKTRTYWKLGAKPFEEGPEEAAENVRGLLTSSIERLADAREPVASALSGGLDSSIVTAVALGYLKAKGRGLTSFSVDYEGNRQNFLTSSFQPEADYSYIEIMTKRLGCEHREIVLKSPDLADALGDAAVERGLPGMADIDSSMLLFAKEIAKSHPVCLSGEGADELFFGYPWYREENFSAFDFNSFPWSPSMETRKGLLKEGLIKGCPEEFIRDLCQKTVSEAELLPSDCEKDRQAKKMFMLNFRWFMRTLIDRGEGLCQAAGLEMRMPFGDHKLAQYAFNMPYEIKTYGGREKGILRYAFKDILPPEIAFRKKSPFPKTFSPEYLNLVKNTLSGLMNQSTYLKEILNPEYLNRLYEAAPYSSPPWYGQLMRLPQLFAYLIQIEHVFREFKVDLKI